MGRPTQSPLSDSNDYRTLGDALNNIYEEMFLSRLPTSAFSVALQSYMKDKAPYLIYGAGDLKEQKPCTPAVYFGLMPMLVQDLIETCKFQYSQLGDESLGKKPTYLAIAISRDDDTIPFTSSSVCEEEIKLGSAEVAILSQTWVANHPLASCVSIVDIHGNGHLNKAFLSFVASEASSLLELPRSELLLNQANRFFYNTRLPDKDDVENLLLACQISTLLGWRYIAYTRVKWGIACLALACQLMAQLESRKERQSTILSNLKCFLSIITVWSFAQLGRSSGCFSVGVDSAAGTLSQFYAKTAKSTSLLLNFHPDVQGISMATIQGEDFNLLCRHLRSNLHVFASENSSRDPLIQAVQHILMLCLLLPRKKTQGYDDSTQRANQVVARCNAALSLLVELGNEKSNQENKVPLLGKLTFQRPPSIGGDIMAMNCTIASILFTTIAQSLQVIIQSGANEVFVFDLCRRLLETPMSLVLETDDMKQTRNSLLHLSKRQSNSTAEFESSPVNWLDSLLPNLSDISCDSLTEETNSEPDLIDCLWGQLQWDAPFDLTAPSTEI